MPRAGTLVLKGPWYEASDDCTAISFIGASGTITAAAGADIILTILPQLVSPSPSGSECQSSADELLERKRRNSKSSPAQSYLLVSHDINCSCPQISILVVYFCIHGASYMHVFTHKPLVAMFYCTSGLALCCVLNSRLGCVCNKYIINIYDAKLVLLVYNT